MSEALAVEPTLRVSRPVLTRLLQRLMPATDRPSKKRGRYTSSPISRQVILSADGGVLRGWVASQGRHFVLTVPADGVLPQVVVPAKVVAECAAALSGDITLTTHRNGLVLESADARFEVAPDEMCDAPEFPKAPDGPTLRFLPGDLPRLLSRSAYAIAGDDNRYGLNGLHLELDGDRVRAVATDGSRLAYASVPFTGELGIPRKRLIPRRVVSLLLGVSGEVSVTFNEKVVRVEWAEGTIHASTLEADFPDYKQVIPTAFARGVTVDRDALIVAVRRVSRMALDSSTSTRWAFEGGRIGLTAGGSKGKATASVPAGLVGEPLTMGMNGRFVIDALNAMPPGPVVIESGGELGCVLLRSLADAAVTAIVMPVRLD